MGAGVKMIEKRGKIKDLNETKLSISKLGGVFLGQYAFIDKVTFNANGIQKLRYVSRNNKPGKRYILIVKCGNEVLSRVEFQNEEDVPKFENYIEYSRIGYEYKLDDMKIFVEDIDRFGASVEIEGNDEKEIDDLLEKIGVVEVLDKSLAEVMKDLDGYNEII
jgi:hypothetical protein